MKKWFKKYKQYITGSICTIIVIAFVFAIVLFKQHGWGSFVVWLNTEHGNVADWASGLGTICALAAVVWQQGRQENLERAINVERSRPRFTLSFYPTITEKSTILYWNRSPKDVENIISTDGFYRFISIENISENMVYDFYVILKYHIAQTSQERIDYWKTAGIGPKEKVVILPKYKGSDLEAERNIVYESLTIKFVTTANEVGFFSTENTTNDPTDNSIGSGRYYFVKGKHIRHVTAVNKDKMIKINSDKCQKFDEMFNSIIGSTSFMEVKSNGNVN